MAFLKRLLPWLFCLVVTLSWDASPTAGVTGYKVYAGPLGGPYVLVAKVGNVLTKTLGNEHDGKCYCVTAHDDKGNESVCSNIVCDEIQDFQLLK